MAITVFPDNPIGIALGGNLFPDTREAQKDALELLSSFFLHDGTIVAVQAHAGSKPTLLFSDARLLQTMDQSIMVQNDMLLVHTNDNRFSWEINESHGVEIWCEQDACGIFFTHYGEEISRTLFMRGAK